ncbi:MAG: hypothetical protein EOM20_20840, partial [Spartobacteria bacterium]|nr:hypothetical protein [Spartobacteria bacterium]
MSDRTHNVWSLLLATATSMAVQAAEPRFPLRDPGTDEVIDYEQYGFYANPGTDQYQYVMTNQQGLA